MTLKIERDPLTGDYTVTVERINPRPGLPEFAVFVFTPSEFKSFAEQVSGELFDMTA
jgi:hypothetical protein